MSDVLIVIFAVVFALATGLAIFGISIWLTDRKSTKSLARDADRVDRDRNINDGFMF